MTARTRGRRFGPRPARSIRTQGMVVISVPTVVILSYVGVALWFTHVNQRAETTLSHAQQVLSTAAALQTDAIHAQASAGSYLLTGALSAFDQYAQSGASVPADLRELQGLTASEPDVTPLMHAVGSDTGVLGSDLSGILLQNPGAAQDAQQIARLDSDDTTLLSDLALLQRHEQSVAEQQRSLVHSSSSLLETLGILGALAVVLGGALLSLLFTSRVARRLQRLEDATDALVLGEPSAGREDNPQRRRRRGQGGTLSGHDEIGRLAAHLGHAAVLLREGERERDRARSELDDVLANSPVVSLRYDARTHCLVHASPNVGRLFGIDVSEALADFETVVERIHPDDRVALRRVLHGSGYHTGERFELVLRVRPEPSVGPWHFAQTVVTVQIGDDDHLDDAVMYLVDVTERLHAEREAEERRNLLESIFDASPDTITVRDTSGRMLLASDDGPADGTEKPADGFAIGDGPDTPLAEVLARCLAGETRPAPVVTTAPPGPTGTGAVFETRARPVVGRDGEVTGTVTVSRDVTDRVRLEESLRTASEAAERASAAKSEFLSRMSHELRTPLNAILGFAQLLEMDELSSDQAASIDQIGRAGRHLLALINEVLDISRIEAGHVTLSIEPVSLSEVLGEVATLLAPVAETHGVRLSRDVAGTGECHLRADRQRLLQVLLNLGSNAIKYNQRGGTAVLRTVPVGERVRIDVTDSGPGIPTDQLDQLFQPFSRLGAERSGVEGTGVGLALSKQLVELMGGSIDVASTPGTGSTFSVTLDTMVAPGAEEWPDDDRSAPVPPDPHADGGRRTGRPHPDPAEPPRGPGPADHTELPERRGRRANPIHRNGAATPARNRTSEAGEAPGEVVVLYVEDNASNAYLVAQILARREQIRLLSASEAGTGLELARSHRPDLVLLDLHLPDLPGDVFLERLRADPVLADTKVVVVSADATPGRIRTMLDMGVRGYLTKPIDVDALLRLVDEEVGSRP